MRAVQLRSLRTLINAVAASLIAVLNAFVMVRGDFNRLYMLILSLSILKITVPP